MRVVCECGEVYRVELAAEGSGKGPLYHCERLPGLPHERPLQRCITCGRVLSDSTRSRPQASDGTPFCRAHLNLIGGEDE